MLLNQGLEQPREVCVVLKEHSIFARVSGRGLKTWRNIHYVPYSCLTPRIFHYGLMKNSAGYIFTLINHVNPYFRSLNFSELLSFTPILYNPEEICEYVQVVTWVMWFSFTIQSS